MECSENNAYNVSLKHVCIGKADGFKMNAGTDLCPES